MKSKIVNTQVQHQPCVLLRSTESHAKNVSYNPHIKYEEKAIHIINARQAHFKRQTSSGMNQKQTKNDVLTMQASANHLSSALTIYEEECELLLLLLRSTILFLPLPFLSLAVECACLIH